MICMVQRVLSDKTYLSLGLLSPLGLLLQWPSINADEDVSQSVFMVPSLFCSCVFTQPSSINVGPPLARQRHAISMAFRWLTDGGPLCFVNWVGTTVII